MHKRNHKKRSDFRKVILLRAAAVCLPLMMVFALLIQTASAKTYVITDGQRVFTYTTSETNPEEVLGQAGLELTENDTYTTATDGSDTSITIRRAQTVTVDQYGDITAIHTYGETVGSLLATLNIILDAQDEITYEFNDETFDGMYIRIQRTVIQEETYASSVPHETSYCYDSSLPLGTEEVLVEGQDGELLCTAEVTYVNGIESERRILTQTVTRGTTEEVIAIGTGITQEKVADDAMPIIGDGYILLPTGEVLTFTDTAQVRATAYTHTDAGCDLITATGSTVHIGTVAVDPRYIPYGTRMFIVANDGSYVYGVSEAEDCGGAIKGDRVDLYFPTYEECIQFGWRNCTIYFLG